MRTFRAKFCNLRHFAPCWLWHVHPKSEWNQYESVLSTSIFSRVLVLAADPEELDRVVFSFIAHHSIIDPCWLRDIAGLAALIEVALYKIECHTPMEDLLCIQYTVSPFMHSVHDSLHSSHQSRCETISPDWNNLLLQQPPKDLPPEKKKVFCKIQSTPVGGVNSCTIVPSIAPCRRKLYMFFTKCVTSRVSDAKSSKSCAMATARADSSRSFMAWRQRPGRSRTKLTKPKQIFLV